MKTTQVHRKLVISLLILLIGTTTLTAQQLPDSAFVNLSEISKEMRLDMKYATSENFLKSPVYDCAECYLRRIAAEALSKANADFLSRGYQIKIFDCYRPLDIQKRMWQLLPDATYVANPAKGSVHNRGLAVDITLVDSTGAELDMGTKFDHFGPEAAYNYSEMPKEIRRNRKLLARIMKRHGFKVLKSEWWHFNYQYEEKAAVSNFRWKCDH